MSFQKTFFNQRLKLGFAKSTEVIPQGEYGPNDNLLISPSNDNLLLSPSGTDKLLLTPQSA